MVPKWIAALAIVLLWWGNASAQCELAVDYIDEFDSTRMLATAPRDIGYQVPSLFETEEGFTFIQEAQVLFSFTQNDTLDAVFMTLAVPEYKYHKIEPGRNVGLKLKTGQIIWLLNIPDRGTFDRNTNMRVYLHTCALPLDVYYNLLLNPIEKIRVSYAGYNHNMTLLPQQQEGIQADLNCIGKRLGAFPVKP